MVKMMQKIKPYRNKKYIDWVKSLPCCITGMPADDAHHLIGYGLGGMGTTASDCFTIPLTRYMHTQLHLDSRAWEDIHGSQVDYCIETLHRAMEEKIITDSILTEQIYIIPNTDLRKQFGLCLLCT